MKVIKNTLIAALMAGSMVAVSAKNLQDYRATEIVDIPGPASYTDSATAGRFGTDVDDYMGVNDWSGVEFDKGFGFIGYNFNSAFNMGYATHLKDNYLGLWFGGYGADFKMNSVFSDDTDVTPNSYTYEATKDKNYAASVLFGTAKGLGIKTSFFYAPTVGKYTKADLSEKEYSDENVWELYGDLQIGLGDEKATHFEVGLDSFVAKITTEAGWNDKSFYDLYLRGGLTVNDWDLDLDTRWRISPFQTTDGKEDADKNYSYGTTNNFIQFTAGRGFRVDPTDKLALKAKFSLPLGFGIKADYDATKNGDDDWVYNTSRTHNIDILFTPSLKLGAVYQVLPEKFNFNAGTKLALGSLGWNIDVTGTRDKNDSASYDRTKTDVTFGWDSSSMDVEWTSGFTVFFGKNVTLDAEYAILSRVLDGFSSNDNTFNGAGVNETVGRVFFSDSINLLLTVKF